MQVNDTLKKLIGTCITVKLNYTFFWKDVSYSNKDEIFLAEFPFVCNAR